MDEEDVRYDVFNVIFDMIFDNIDLRTKVNKLSLRVLDQANMNIDKTVVNFFRRKQEALFGFTSLQTAAFRERLLETKQAEKGPAGMFKDTQSYMQAASSLKTDEDFDDEFSDEDLEKASERIQSEANQIQENDA